jgi:hypothetical protein
MFGAGFVLFSSPPVWTFCKHFGHKLWYLQSHSALLPVPANPFILGALFNYFSRNQHPFQIGQLKFDFTSQTLTPVDHGLVKFLFFILRIQILLPCVFVDHLLQPH